MKTFYLILTTITLAVTVNAQEERTTETKEDVVINHKMIESFNNAEYTYGVMDFIEVLSNYSFEDAKLILIGYRAGKVELNSNDISSYLASTKEVLEHETNPERYSEDHVYAER